MQSFLHGTLLHDSGYFHVWISSIKTAVFFASSADKAFFMTLIQDYLSPRAKLGGVSIKTNGYSCDVDLLAFSLTDNGIHLLVHTTKKAAIEEFGQALLISYQSHLQQRRACISLPFDTIFMFDKLTGRHEALNVSREMHLLHEAWRYDRYSSIGFYLDDRRGDWMHPFRITSLFGGNPKLYLQFIKSQKTESDRVFEYLET